MKRLFYISLTTLMFYACSPTSNIPIVHSINHTTTPTIATAALSAPTLPKVSEELTPQVVGSPTIKTTAQYNRFPDVQPEVTGLVADLKVCTEKITYFMVPSKAVVQGGVENVIKTAVSEALVANGNGDVLVSLNCQIKYDRNGVPESITVTGYPASYVNFRPSDPTAVYATPDVIPSSNVEVVEVNK